jgi:hypothetical protein
MALPSLSRISCEAKKRWSLFGVAVTHRLGRVPIGEESVLIAVSAGHRREAWDAAEWILEELKRKTEIWKRESYEDPLQKPEWKANSTASTFLCERVLIQFLGRLYCLVRLGRENRHIFNVYLNVILESLGFPCHVFLYKFRLDIRHDSCSQSGRGKRQRISLCIS